MFRQVQKQNKYIDTVNGIVFLKSYSSIIARYDRKSHTLILGSHWNYSITTLKHLYKFFREEGINLPHSSKEINRMISNGEIEEIENSKMYDVYYNDKKEV